MSSALRRHDRRTLRTRLAVVAIATAGLIGASHTSVAAEAFHLRLLKSEPNKGDTVTSPKVVRLWFSEPAQLPVTSVKLLASDDSEVPLGKPTFAGSASAPVEAAVATTLAPGRYTLSYKTASKDMHPITGDFVFVVR